MQFIKNSIFYTFISLILISIFSCTNTTISEEETPFTEEVKEIFNERTETKKGYGYKATFCYPLFTEEFPELNKKVSSIIKPYFNEFVSEAEDYDDYLAPNGYEFTQKWEKGIINQNIISFIISIYTFEGGSHGTSIQIAINYDVKKKAFLSIEEASKKSAEQISTFSRTALAEKYSIKDKNTLSWINKGTDIKDKDSFSLFLIKEDGILIRFQPYQVLPYSYGFPEILMKY